MQRNKLLSRVIICFTMVVFAGTFTFVLHNKCEASQKTGLATISKEWKNDPDVVVRKNVVVKGKKYRCIVYKKIDRKRINVLSITAKGKTLVVPSKIDGFSVYGFGSNVDYNPDDMDEGDYDVINSAYDSFDKIVFENGIRIIRAMTFSQSRIKSVKLPSSLREIGDRAFYAGNLKSINLGNVRKIGWGAFQECEKLKKIDLSKMSSAGDYAFSGCKRLGKVNMPSSMSGRLGYECFAYSGIETVRFPELESVQSCGELVFFECKSLKNISFSNKTRNVYFNRSLFLKCTKLKKITFPANIKKVVYKSSPCAGNYTNNVNTLKFEGKGTELSGEELQDSPNSTVVTVNEIIAPDGSKIAKMANNIYMKESFTEEQLEEINQYDLEDSSWYQSGLVPIKLSTV